MRKQLIIGIDPDTEKSGVCILDTRDAITCKLYTLSFFKLFDLLREQQDCIVVVEAGWLNKVSNYHSSKNIRTSNLISKHVGANHEVGKLIVEMCNYLNIDCCLKKPLRKVWMGGKISHVELTKILPEVGSSTNQEQRDAALIAIDYAGLPIRF